MLLSELVDDLDRRLLGVVGEVGVRDSCDGIRGEKEAYICVEAGVGEPPSETAAESDTSSS
jgi:hypothetical protein